MLGGGSDTTCTLKKIIMRLTVTLEKLVINPNSVHKVHAVNCLFTVYCFCFAVKKFHGLTSFLSFPEKLSRLPVTLPILGTLDSNIHGKNFRGDKAIRENSEIFHSEAKAIYGN